ncbi:YeeE/YedE family protein [Dyadobacter sp. CY326]|uniref:YeeE/YedE family protein n=1 Tax=Dyadobacter sp. CY326 TaxID=2907300 RepID=UPI001F433F8A|nr:YeeE/YedE thiosulfate transporter family protein [Dyadobacter sp. CY326]MCE7066305.1 YeeE/YedE family protein [Dyadobacter sp. CY326]
MDVLEIIRKPWPWFIAGPLIGLTVPALLLLGNKSFGISSSLRHICAAVIPANISFFKYDWKKGIWNLFFVTGIIIGGFIAGIYLANPDEIVVADATQQTLRGLGLTDFSGLMPKEIFSAANILSLKGLIFLVLGGFLVGFGTRYAGGCTSGHSITGLATLQWPSLVATMCFMIGGLICTHWILPFLFTLVL